MACRFTDASGTRGSALYLILYVALIVFFAFFYTATVFNPKDTADNLKNMAVSCGVAQRTAEYIDYILTRITAIGALIFALICVLREWLISLCVAAFLFWRHFAIDRRQRDNGYCGPDTLDHSRPISTKD